MASEPSIDIEVDRPLQERHWLFSRVLWAIMLALILVALLGLTGSGGPLSRQQVAAGPAELDIPRVSRWEAADELTVEIDQAAPGEIEVMVPKKFGEIFAIESVTPQPSSVSATPDGYRYAFASTNGAGERSIVFSIRASHVLLPSRMGRFAVNGERTAELPIVVLP